MFYWLLVVGVQGLGFGVKGLGLRFRVSREYGDISQSGLEGIFYIGILEKKMQATVYIGILIGNMGRYYIEPIFPCSLLKTSRFSRGCKHTGRRVWGTGLPK